MVGGDKLRLQMPRLWIVSKCTQWSILALNDGSDKNVDSCWSLPISLYTSVSTKVWLDEQTRNACTRKHILKSLLAWVATVSLSFRSKERQRNDEERDFFLTWPREKWNVSLTLIPCSLLRNRSEIAPLQNACYILCRLKVSKSFALLSL